MISTNSGLVGKTEISHWLNACKTKVSFSIAGVLPSPSFCGGGRRKGEWLFVLFFFARRPPSSPTRAVLTTPHDDDDDDDDDAPPRHCLSHQHQACRTNLVLRVPLCE